MPREPWRPKARFPWLTLSPEKALDQKNQEVELEPTTMVSDFICWFIWIYIDCWFIYILIYIDLYHWFVCGQFAILFHFWIFRTPLFCLRSAVLYIYMNIHIVQIHVHKLYTLYIHNIKLISNCTYSWLCVNHLATLQIYSYIHCGHDMATYPCTKKIHYLCCPL